MSEFRDEKGNLFYIKEHPYTGEKVQDPNDLIEMQQRRRLSTHYIDSWSFIVREYKSDSGRSICTNKFIFDAEHKATEYLISNDWVIDGRTSRYKRASMEDELEFAEITCEIIKLRVN